MVKWVQMLRDGEWVFVRPEQIAYIGVKSEGNNEVLFANAGGDTVYLVYPRELKGPIDSYVLDWLEEESVNVLTLWHLRLSPGLGPFIDDVFYLWLHSEALVRDREAFKDEEKLREVLAGIIQEHIGKEVEIPDNSYLLEDIPGRFFYQLLPFDGEREFFGYKVRYEDGKYIYTLLPEHDWVWDLKGLTSIVMERHKFIEFVENTYPPE